VQQTGNAGFGAMAWAERIMRTSGSQVRRGGELEKSTRRLRFLSNPGQPLDVGTRRRMETSLGYSLVKVNMHHGYHVEDLSSRLGARSFTSKGQVVSRRQNIDSGTIRELGLLSRELTHVAQQAQPSALPQNAGTVMLASTENAPPPTGSRSRQTQGQPGEQGATQSASEERQQSPPPIDVIGVADRIYRLMKHDLILERERSTDFGG
jgi:hypothetical protein